MGIVLVIPVVLGLLTGYFINYLADVLPVTLKLSQPTCKNPDCKKQKSWGEFIFLKRCSNCRKRTTVRFIVVLLVSLVIILYTWFQPPLKLGFMTGYFVFIYLFLVTLIDIETRLVLRILSIIGLILCLYAGWQMRGWQATLIGGAVGFGVMLVFYLLGILFTRWRNRRLGGAKDDEEALGSGDVTLATLLGLLVGWPLIGFNLLIGILLAGVFSLLMVLVLLATRKYKSMMAFIAYGPFFNIVAFLLVFFPKWISALLPSG